MQQLRRCPPATLAQHGLLFATCIAAGAVCAQTPDDELIRRQEQRREAEQLQRDNAAAPALTGTAPDALEPLPVEALCFEIARVALDGAEPFAFLQEVAAAIEGRCIGVAGLQVVQRRLQRALIEQGFVTSRALVPEQNLGAGVLRVQIVPGRVDGMVQEGRTRGWMRMVLPLHPDGLLDQRNLDAAIENLRRLPSESATEIAIQPSSTPGGSELVVRHSGDKPWRGVVSLDNAGSKATGAVGAALTLAVDSPLGLYDQLTYTHNRNAQSDASLGNRGHSLQWSVPFGLWGLTLGANRYRYLQSVAGFSGPIRYSGNSAGRELGVTFATWRSISAKTTLAAKLVQRESRSYIEDIEVGVQARDASFADLSLAHRQQLASATFDGTVGLRVGLPGQSPKPGIIAGEPDFNGNGRIAQATAGLTVPVALPGVALSYRTQWRVQHAVRTVASSDYFSIGNRYSVRGFSGERSLAAASGALMRHELGWALPWDTASLEAYAALDAGLVRGAGSELLAGRALGGAALGLRARAHSLNADLAVAAPWHQPDNFGPREPTLYASLAYDF